MTFTFQHALFENTRKLPPSTSICSTEHSDVSSVNEAPHRVQPSRLPTEPWQVTKKHLNLSPQEIASLGSGEPGQTTEDMNAKVLKVRKGWKIMIKQHFIIIKCFTILQFNNIAMARRPNCLFCYLYS